jgi:hypothetical protein
VNTTFIADCGSDEDISDLWSNFFIPVSLTTFTSYLHQCTIGEMHLVFQAENPQPSAGWVVPKYMMRINYF